jgi:hypothetical protein
MFVLCGGSFTSFVDLIIQLFHLISVLYCDDYSIINNATRVI